MNNQKKGNGGDKNPQGPAWEVTIEIYPPGHSKAPCQVKGFPGDYNQAMNFMLMGVRTVSDFFIKESLQGNVQVEQKSNIIKGTNLPPALFGRKR